jgi:hypothetical protein
MNPYSDDNNSDDEDHLMTYKPVSILDRGLDIPDEDFNYGEGGANKGGNIDNTVSNRISYDPDHHFYEARMSEQVKDRPLFGNNRDISQIDEDAFYRAESIQFD